MNLLIPLILALTAIGPDPEGLSRLSSERVPLEVRADQSEYVTAEGLLILTGNVNLIGGTLSICADRMVFEVESAIITAEGNVILYDDGERLFGNLAIYNWNTGDGVITDARYDGTDLFGEAREIRILRRGDKREYILVRGRLTTCDFPYPHYEIRPRTVRLILGDEIAAYETGLYVQGYPVAWFPYLRRSIADHQYGWVTTPGYSNRKGGVLLNKFTWHLHDQFRPRLYLDGYTDLGVGTGAGAIYGQEGTGLSGRTYGYYIEMDKDSPYIDDDQARVRGVEPERWRVAGHHRQEPLEDLVLTSRYDILSDRNYNHDMRAEERLRALPTNDLEADRGSFVNLAKRWDEVNLRILYLERLHDFHISEMPSLERRPQIVLDTTRNRILDSPFYWEALFQYDDRLRLEQEYELGDRPGQGVRWGDRLTEVAQTSRGHGQFQVMAPFSISPALQAIPRAGIRATAYQNTVRETYFHDNHGATDSKLIRDFDDTSQVAPHAGIVFHSRPIFDMDGVAWAPWERMRFVTEPSVSFDAYWADKNLEKAWADGVQSRGPKAGLLGPISPGPVGMTYPQFDELDFPQRDAQILAFRLDNRLQARKGARTKDLFVHSLTVSHDFEPDHDGTSNLESEARVALWGDWYFRNFTDYNLQDDFLEHLAFQLGGKIYREILWDVVFTRFQRNSFADVREYVGTNLTLPLQKYTLGFGVRHDIEKNVNLSTHCRISRDLHDGIAHLEFSYRNREQGDDEFEVRLLFDFVLASQRPDRNLH